ncbi:MAG: DUF1552 domain-containing protein [Archangium sp.]|nr:DUF1552 domain-containing protein [Archangium sp.]
MLSRRSALGAGLSLIAAPFLNARAQALPQARRLVLFFTPNGTAHRVERWHPTSTSMGFTVAPGSILEPLMAHQASLLPISGLYFPDATNHEGGMRAMLTAGGPDSVDQYIAARIGGGSRFRSLSFGVQTSAWGANAQTRMSYAGGQLVHPEDSPANVFTRLFGAVAGGPTELAKLRRRRQSILDAVRGDLGALKSRLGTEQATKLDAHLSALRAMEIGLDAPPPSGMGCTTPVLSMDSQDPSNFPAITRAQLELMVSALACDMTRVATVQLAHTVSPLVPTWLGSTTSHHELSHRGDDEFVRAERWFSEQFGALLTLLAARQDPAGGGSLLDTSAVVWVKELGDGGLHTCEDVPFVLAGKAGGRWNPGRYLARPGVPHTKLLTELCQAMGLTDDYFHDQRYRGALEGVS